MKRLLIVTYYWPPAGGSGVQRWLKFAKYLPQFGWQPVIYTPENPEIPATDNSQSKDIPECAEIVRTRIIEPYAIARKLTGAKSLEVTPVNAQKKSIKQKLSLWVRGNFFVPDPRIGWVRPSVAFLKKYLSEHPVDAVVTTGPPHSVHLIGRGLKRALGLRWIADFRDPWTQMFYFKHLNLGPGALRRHKRLEKSVLDEADLIVSVSPQVRDDFAAMTSTPVALITNGYDEDDFAACAEASSFIGEKDRFTISHTGLFAADGNPLALWELLSRKCAEDKCFAEQLRILLAGKVDSQVIAAIKESGLEGNLVLRGYLPHNETVAEQKAADILILPLRIEPECSKVLPGKIFEYLAAHRPIMGIGQEEGASASVLSETCSGQMFDWDNGKGMEEFIDREWKRHLKGERKPVGKNTGHYSRKNLTEKLVDCINNYGCQN